MAYKLALSDHTVKEIVSGHIHNMRNDSDFVDFLLFVLEHGNDWEGTDYSRGKKIIDKKQREHIKIWG